VFATAGPGSDFAFYRDRILVMDDDRIFRLLLHEQLSSCGYEVETTASGEDAVSAYRRALAAGRPFAAVILDLQVPDGMGGEQALAELKRLDPGVKALVCSGSLKGTRADYEQAGFRGILGKPYTLADLRSAVDTVVQSVGQGGWPR
jgi:CheY-like chemotaxis protein